ncbi:hypothetical protein AB0M38_15650 [Streptomyces sp. NPDC051742]|uniref:LNS2 domain-containing protein n=1 Tax=unclassified Streptomyces TaxID=2593676 RepID=UPI0034367EAC
MTADNRPLAVFDLDNTLAATAHRQHFLDIVYLTGRPERCRRDTLDWLAAHRLPEGPVHMRRNRDFRPARVTKVEILRRLGADRTVRMLVDDDLLVCDAAEAAGFRVVRALWATPSQTLRDAQEKEGRT